MQNMQDIQNTQNTQNMQNTTDILMKNAVDVKKNKLSVILVSN